MIAARPTRALARALAIVLLAALLLAHPARAETIDVVVTQPWLALIVSFLGGPNVSVTSLQEWGAEGELVRRKKGKKAAPLPEGALIIALDSSDAQAAGLGIDAREDVRHLYGPFPIGGADVDASFSDPSVIPFVAQRALTALSSWDPSNYPYYQRRLAELQARLSSSVLAARRVLQGVRVYDLTGSSRALLMAAGCDIEAPDPERLKEWAKGRTAGLVELLDERRAEGVFVVADARTPRAIRRVLAGRPGVSLLARPQMDQDWPTFLHDQLISLWQDIEKRSAPSKRR